MLVFVDGIGAGPNGSQQRRLSLESAGGKSVSTLVSVTLSGGGSVTECPLATGDNLRRTLGDQLPAIYMCAGQSASLAFLGGWGASLCTVEIVRPISGDYYSGRNDRQRPLTILMMET